MSAEDVPSRVPQPAVSSRRKLTPDPRTPPRGSSPLSPAAQSTWPLPWDGRPPAEGVRNWWAFAPLSMPASVRFRNNDGGGRVPPGGVQEGDASHWRRPQPMARFRSVYAIVGALLLALPMTMRAEGDSLSEELSVSSPMGSGWTRDGNEFVCRHGSETVRVHLNEKHSWDDLDRPPTSNVFAWAADSGAYLASFTFKKPDTTLRYYGPKCETLFSTRFPEEIENMQFFAGGRRILAFTVQPYTPEWGESWVEFGHLRLLDEAGTVLFSTGPYELSGGASGYRWLCDHDRYCQLRVPGVKTEGGPWRVLRIFLDTLFGHHYAHWEDKTPGQSISKVEISPEGKLTIKAGRLYGPDGKPLDMGPFPPGTWKKEWTIVEHQFPQ